MPKKRRKRDNGRAGRVSGGKGIIGYGACGINKVSGKGAYMAGGRRVQPWFARFRRRRTRGVRRYGLEGVEVMGRRRRRWYRYGLPMAGGAGGGRVGAVLQQGAMTVAGAALGSIIAARVPLPAPVARVRAVVPIALGLALGASRFGRTGPAASIALGMVVAGGLALGRQFAPAVFAGEDEMLGLPMLESDDKLGLEYQGAEETGEGETVGEDTDEVAGEEPELFGAFATAADV